MKKMVSCHPASSIILPHPGLHRLRGDTVLGYHDHGMDSAESVDR